MAGYTYYQAKVCTSDHKRFANLPRHAAKILIELPASKVGQVIPIIIKLASGCFERRFKLNSLILRTTEVDQIVPVFPPRERNCDCDYENETGRSWILEDLSDKLSQSRKPVPPAS